MMMKLRALYASLTKDGVEGIIRVAGVAAIAGLFFMVLPSFIQSPLLLIIGMSLGQVFGLTGVLLFALAVLLEAAGETRERRPPGDEPPLD